jgi:hypothetical protein
MKNHSFEFLSDTIFPDILLKCRWYDGVFYTLSDLEIKRNIKPLSHPDSFTYSMFSAGLKNSAAPSNSEGVFVKKLVKFSKRR